MADYRSMYLCLADEVERALDILDSRRNAEQQVFLTKADGFANATAAWAAFDAQ